MRHVLASLAVTLVLMGWSTVNAAEPGQISDSLMAGMGLSGITTLADHEGDTIRGAGRGGYGGPVIIHKESVKYFNLSYKHTKQGYYKESKSLNIKYFSAKKVTIIKYPSPR